MSRQIEFDAFKGILICLIVLGHNTLFSRHYPIAFNALYNFHVASFLLLPFLFHGVSAREYQIKNRVVRYLVPHFVFFSIACVAFFIIFVSRNDQEIGEWLKAVTVAIIVSSEGAYRTASGFGLFWFLPALLIMVLLRTAYFRGNSSRRLMIVSIAIGTHFLLGLIPNHWLAWIPWSVPLVLFLFPVGLLVGWLWQHGIQRIGYFALSAAVLGACIYLGVIWPSSVGLAGDPRVYALDQPFHLGFHDLYLVAGFLALLLLCWRLPSLLTRGLAQIGDRSLFVFLVHSFVFQTLNMSGLLALMESSLQLPIFAVAVSFALTLTITLLGHRILVAWPRVYALVFPRSIVSWRAALGIGKL